MSMTQAPPELLADGELYLRRWQVSDADALEAAASSSIAELSLWMPWAAKGYSGKDAQQFLEFTTRSWEAGDQYDYAVIIDGQPSGSCGLMRPSREKTDTFEIGYWLATNVTGRGWATRAAALLVKVARELDAKQVRIVHAQLNIRSSKIPLRLGFTCTGTHSMVLRGSEERAQCVVWELALAQQT
ncbi:hypothetical protein E4U43_008603 [Claviceps pusilla]|uniref:N-acetyltransferase domain-containing protein n=1 Tax=Claviceps pusilla TaxID=123648 RepID=A0A9P7NAF0_9HYPO|nr:hypothetical protein E4U43_008603 [Claviceps pusilla]